MKKVYRFVFAVMCLSALSLYAQDSFFDDEESDNAVSDSEKLSTLQFGGFGTVSMRFWLHKELQSANASSVLGINLKYNASKTEFDSNLRINMRTISEYPFDILDELTMRVYLGDFVLSAGKMKIVWGKGDMLHVLDVFNANDFTDFTVPTYIDRRIGEPMIHFAYNAPIPLRLEAVWAPSMTPDRIALNGPWVPLQIHEIKKRARDILLNEDVASGSFYDIIEKKLADTIENTLKTLKPNSGETDITLPVLTDSEINEIVNKFPLLERPAVRAVLLVLSGKNISVDIGGIMTDEKIKKIAQEESEKYTQLLKTELPNKLKAAADRVDGISLDPFIKFGMNSFLPDMTKIKYGQYGLRLTGSVKNTDIGGQYYYGHYKTPSVDFQKLLTNTINAKSIKECIYYDPVHIFGIDFGAAIAMFNLRSEFAYYMTYDFKGTNPAIHNNSLQWVLGFDVDIPVNNITVNVQNLGSCILGFKNVKKNNDAEGFDMDWNTAQKPTNNKLVIHISDSWMHDTLTDSLTVIWGIEHRDVVLMPNIKYKVKDELYVESKAAYIYAKNKKSEFASWKNNHFLQFGVEYHF